MGKNKRMKLRYIESRIKHKLSNIKYKLAGTLYHMPRKVCKEAYCKFEPPILELNYFINRQDYKIEKYHYRFCIPVDCNKKLAGKIEDEAKESLLFSLKPHIEIKNDDYENKQDHLNLWYIATVYIGIKNANLWGE